MDGICLGDEIGQHGGQRCGAQEPIAGRSGAVFLAACEANDPSRRIVSISHRWSADVPMQVRSQIVLDVAIKAGLRPVVSRYESATYRREHGPDVVILTNIKAEGVVSLSLRRANLFIRAPH